MAETNENSPEITISAEIVPAPVTGSQIPGIIQAFEQRIRAIRACAKDHLTIAGKAGSRWVSKLATTVTTFKRMADDAKTDPTGGPRLISQISDFAQTLSEEIHSAAVFHSDILSRSLLIFGFAAFDAYIGMFLTRLYQESPNLVFGLTEKEVKVGELVKCQTLEEAIKNVIDREVNSHTRNSYEEQFATLATRHNLKKGWGISEWPRFIETAQRRNLITHCNGVVNSQYLDACKRVGVSLDAETVSGKELKVDHNYLRDALDIIYEVGTILGHTLWRKSSPQLVGKSEEALNAQIFTLLRLKEWKLATKVGKFAVENKDPKGDFMPKLLALNYAQALKWSGEMQSALAIVDAIDWQASIRDLRLGVEVLKENYDNAAELMRKIGKEGGLVNESGYSKWPIFREFRKSPQFLSAYKDIYAVEFTDRLATGNKKPNQSSMAEASAEPAIRPNDGEPAMPSKPMTDDELDQLDQDIDCAADDDAANDGH